MNNLTCDAAIKSQLSTRVCVQKYRSTRLAKPEMLPAAERVALRAEQVPWCTFTRASDTSHPDYRRMIQILNF